MTNAQILAEARMLKNVLESMEENGYRGKTTDEKLKVLNKWSITMCLDAWLSWNGIIRYTDSIMRFVRAYSSSAHEASDQTSKEQPE